MFVYCIDESVSRFRWHSMFFGKFGSMVRPYADVGHVTIFSAKGICKNNTRTLTRECFAAFSIPCLFNGFG